MRGRSVIWISTILTSWDEGSEYDPDLYNTVIMGMVSGGHLDLYNSVAMILGGGVSSGSLQYCHHGMRGGVLSGSIKLSSWDEGAECHMELYNTVIMG